MIDVESGTKEQFANHTDTWVLAARGQMCRHYNCFASKVKSLAHSEEGSSSKSWQC